MSDVTPSWSYQLHRIMVVGQRDGSATVNMAEPSSLGQLWEGEPRNNRSLQQLS
jgi:hypothetical protein